MTYQRGDYVYPADLPRPLLCRVSRAETLAVRKGCSQLLRLQPLEGPWPTGTELIRLDNWVLPANPRELWRGPAVRAVPPRRTRSARDAA
jgi:hypothetical protein